ncbi:hypothetical protein VE03_04062 [Pseudogymnoascus sp. 23342-1-I1]|nr:hypothetical protein VE03_04062 [Pseudogymnoascus sp. 23342-1-I1]
MATSDESGWKRVQLQLPRPVANFLGRFQDQRQHEKSEPSYQLLAQDGTSSGNWRDCRRNMIFRILFWAFVVGGASSYLYFDQTCGKHPNLQTSEYLITNVIGAKQLPSLYEADIDTLARGLKSREFASVDLAYIARINEVNDALSAVTEVNPDALFIASVLDNERSEGVVRGPLHGIPILIKDIIATNDSMNNTAGSYALVGAKVRTDSTIAKKLREARAIILGKTNPSEWGNFRMLLNSSNGWSAYGGQTYGPFYPNQDPSDSSSGSAVAASISDGQPSSSPSHPKSCQ